MSDIQIKYLDTQDYASVFAKMREFTNKRTPDTTDEIWCLQHPAVYTLGANADKQHILKNTEIPIIQSDRGGQVTYHGPGQIIIYCLIDLRRRKLGVKNLVQRIEKSVVSLLNDYQIESKARADAHGVYIDDAKVASLGLRVSGGCSYHGVALNVDMDLSPFTYINPCGFSGLKVTQLKDHGVQTSFGELQIELINHLCEQLNYNKAKAATFG